MHILMLLSVFLCFLVLISVVCLFSNNCNLCLKHWVPLSRITFAVWSQIIFLSHQSLRIIMFYSNYVVGWVKFFAHFSSNDCFLCMQALWTWYSYYFRVSWKQLGSVVLDIPQEEHLLSSLLVLASLHLMSWRGGSFPNVNTSSSPPSLFPLFFLFPSLNHVPLNY